MEEKISIDSEKLSSGRLPEYDYTWYNDKTIYEEEFTVEEYQISIIGQRGKYIPVKGDSYKSNRILLTVKNNSGSVVYSDDDVKLDGISYISHHAETKTILKVFRYTEQKEGEAIPVKEMVEEVKENLKDIL